MIRSDDHSEGYFLIAVGGRDNPGAHDFDDFNRDVAYTTSRSQYQQGFTRLQ